MSDDSAPRLTGAFLIMTLVVVIIALLVPSAFAAEDAVADAPSPGLEPRTQPSTQQDVSRKPAKTHGAKVKAEVRKARERAKASGGNAQVGVASWYGKDFAKKKTANGEKFSPNQPTAAHRTLPIGTHVKVTNLATGKSTTVRVNDRGPYEKDRVIDLSQSAAKDIGMKKDGVAPVKIEVVGHDTGETAAENNAQVKQEAATQKTGQQAPPAQTASNTPSPSPTGASPAGAPPPSSATPPAPAVKPVSETASSAWWSLGRSSRIW